jgi:hypothetical protein
LKLAIGRLQNEIEETTNTGGEGKAIEEGTENKAKIFLTENSNQMPAELGQMQRSMIENTTTTAPNSVFDPGFSKMSAL